MSTKPVLAVVGRPNVGKSQLVNRILGRREAVVQDKPGVTRDRVSYDANWNGRDFVIVDTGGWVSDAQGMAAQIAEQAELAIGAADAVLFVVDATVGITDEDEAVVRVLRRSGKPVVLAANKVDDQRGEAEADRPVGDALKLLRRYGQRIDHRVEAGLLDRAPLLRRARGAPRRGLAALDLRTAHDFILMTGLPPRYVRRVRHNPCRWRALARARG